MFVKYKPSGISVYCPFCRKQQANPLRLEDYKDWMKKKNHSQYLRHKARVLERCAKRTEMLNHKWYNDVPCSICGIKNGYKMSYHHVIPDTKKYGIVEMIARPNKYSDDDIQAEVDKCVMLCNSCHHSVHIYARNKHISVKESLIRSYVKKMVNIEDADAYAEAMIAAVPNDSKVLTAVLKLLETRHKLSGGKDNPLLEEE